MKSIKKGSFSRGLSIAKLGLRTGAKAAGNYIKGGDQDEYLTEQMRIIAKEFGELKGTAMKLGQGLSMYGEHFLPPKANAFLKSLQFQSPPMDWEAIEAVIEKELGFGVFVDLDIEEKAIASASLGQVHKATNKKTGEVYAMKVQYPGVADAIESDVKNLKRFFTLAKVIPADLDLDEIFDEIKTMLYQETNYSIEKSWTRKIYDSLKDDDRFLVPKPIDQFSTVKILTTTFLEGVAVDSEEVKNLSQEEKDELGFSFLDHYLDELFVHKAVQTDAHLGNYKIQINPGGKNKIIQFDFGAMRVVPESFSKGFHLLLNGGAILKEDALIEKAGRDLKYLRDGDPQELVDIYVEMCNLILEPFRGLDSLEFSTPEGGYHWQQTDLPSRVAKAGTYIAKNFKLRTPPKEAIFLDRKLAGAFFFLTVIDFKANTYEWLKEKLK